MAVVFITTLPPEVQRGIEEAVSQEMDVANNPPDGLIVHTASEVDGRVRIVDVWESREKFLAFERDRLIPAIVKVSGMPADAGPPDMEREVFEPYRVQRG